MTMVKRGRNTYILFDEKEIPEGVRFDVPGFEQGQIVEYAYGDFGKSENGNGSPWMRVTDKSDHSVDYYRFAKEE